MVDDCERKCSVVVGVWDISKVRPSQGLSRSFKQSRRNGSEIIRCPPSCDLRGRNGGQPREGRSSQAAFVPAGPAGCSATLHDCRLQTLPYALHCTALHLKLHTAQPSISPHLQHSRDHPSHSAGPWLAQ